MRLSLLAPSLIPTPTEQRADKFSLMAFDSSFNADASGNFTLSQISTPQYATFLVQLRFRHDLTAK
jgi:hypothetical protein